jgi:very-short-patch-repair endonuclease
VLRRVLAERPDDYIAPASGLEARLVRLLADAGEAPLARQVDVGGHEWTGRVDFLDRSLGIVVEVDSDLHHTSPLDREHDCRRDAALLTAGWRAVVRVTDDEVWRRPHDAVRRIREARARVSVLLAAETDPQESISAARTLGAGPGEVGRLGQVPLPGRTR